MGALRCSIVLLAHEIAEERSVEHLDRKVLAPDGNYVRVTHVYKTIPLAVWRLVTKSHQLEGSAKHLVVTGRDTVPMDEIKNGDVILTVTGWEPLISVYDTGQRRELYDLRVESDAHLYFTSGIASQNSTGIVSADRVKFNIIPRYRVLYITPLKEQAKTIAINDQLRERLRNEELSADERDKINQQIARNDAALVEKQNEIEKKRFKLNKAAAISNAIINTALAVSNALKDLPVPANFIAAGVVGAAGAAQIAAIASQQFVPQASPNPTLTGLGTSQSASPAFNVVGSSQRNQLAEAVSSALSDKPVKAYVVSSDVSSAQELDRRIVEGASI
jgi:hypothetical protein